LVAQATVIRNILFTEWDSLDNLNDRLSKVPLDTQSGDSSNMKEIVYFFDRQQVEGNEHTKAIEVRKINDEDKENQTEYPNFIEIQDVYEITLLWRVTDVEPDSFSLALDDIQSMGTEVLRIMETVFSPSMDNGTFWQVDRSWIKDDMIDQAQPQLKRVLTMRLSKITSFDGSLFKGYNGLLHFGTTSGHLYVNIQNINTGGFGYSQIEEPIVNTSTPVYFTDYLSGSLTADMYVAPDEISSDIADLFAINQIGTVQSNEETFEATLIQLYDNDADPVQRITITTRVKITSVIYVANVQDMLKFSMTGEIIDYPTTTVANAP